MSNINYIGSGGIDNVIINGSITNADFELDAGGKTFKALKEAGDGSEASGKTLTNVNLLSTGSTDKTVYWCGNFKPGATGNDIKYGAHADSGIKIVA